MIRKTLARVKPASKKEQVSHKENIHVSDTAFVTCAFRRLNENLSKDSYAKLWYNEKAELILKDYLNNVSTEGIFKHFIPVIHFNTQ